MEDFATALRRRRFGLSWLYLDALDECGHARGANSPSYSAEVVRRVPPGQTDRPRTPPAFAAATAEGLHERIAPTCRIRKEAR